MTNSTLIDPASETANPSLHQPLARAGVPAASVGKAMQVSFDELSRIPTQQLVRLLLDRAIEDPTLLNRLHETLMSLRAVAPTDHARLIGNSTATQQVLALVRRFEKTDEPVLITGESGTGKELLARAIHDGSCRVQGPFVAVNCAAIPAGLAASELFGYEKGAFTGATARNIGQIEHANGGTLFLDEIGDMPADLQGHLLRFLQEGQIRRVGGRDIMPLDVRIVSATNVRLVEAIATGRFREDLFYRLNVLTLQVPPLRDRPADIEPLALGFLDAASRDFGRSVNGFTAEAMTMLRRYRWPGNVRELKSTIRRAVVVSEGTIIEVAHLRGLEEPFAHSTTAATPLPPGSPEERAVLLATLDRSNENITAAADALGVSRVTLYRMLRRHGIVLRRDTAPVRVGRQPKSAPYPPCL